MPKIFLAALVCTLLGYVVYQNRAQFKLGASSTPPRPVAAAVGAPKQPGKSAAPVAANAKLPAPATAASPLRAEIEAQLKPMKVSSILLGDPSIVIVNKQDYGVGDPLKLPNGKSLTVAAIDESGVTLTCQNEAFHLDAPAAPDLAATRKKL